MYTSLKSESLNSHLVYQNIHAPHIYDIYDSKSEKEIKFNWKKFILLNELPDFATILTSNSDAETNDSSGG